MMVRAQVTFQNKDKLNVDILTGFQLESIWLVELSPPIQWFKCFLKHVFCLKWVNNFIIKFVTLHASVHTCEC